MGVSKEFKINLKKDKKSPALPKSPRLKPVKRQGWVTPTRLVHVPLQGRACITQTELSSRFKKCWIKKMDDSRTRQDAFLYI